MLFETYSIQEQYGLSQSSICQVSLNYTNILNNWMHKQHIFSTTIYSSHGEAPKDIGSKIKTPGGHDAVQDCCSRISAGSNERTIVQKVHKHTHK